VVAFARLRVVIYLFGVSPHDAVNSTHIVRPRVWAREGYPSSLYVSRNTDSTSMYKQGYM
jgi:hypothetical protein